MEYIVLHIVYLYNHGYRFNEQIKVLKIEGRGSYTLLLTHCLSHSTECEMY